MHNFNQYFKLQVQESAEYFENWFYRKEGKVIEFQGKPQKISLYCDLYDVFSKHHQNQEGKERDIAHNCIGCNFEEGARNILLFFNYNKEVNSERYFLTMYTLLFYLQAEKLGVIYKEIGYSKMSKGKIEFNWTSFPELQRIKFWANFFKHPKSFMFLHHPSFFIEGDPDIPNFLVKGVIDEQFIQKYYKCDKHNDDLRLTLENQENFIVIFPSILEFTKSLCTELEKIIQVISNDKKLIEQLVPYTTVKSILSK
jgi:hypothetical protein